jgi:hypothetical protein
VAARNLKRAAVDADSNAQPLLNRAEMPIVLTQEFGEKAMVVEVKFERIFRDYLRNCCFDSRAALNDFSSYLRFLRTRGNLSALPMGS